MILIEHSREDRDVIVLRASGTLTAQDYEDAVPELEHALGLSRGPLRVLVRLEDFRGWEIGALWRELDFGLEHGGALGRVAVVGETGLEKWATELAAPFTSARMRFFPRARLDEAEAWLAEARP
ncbi:MAG: STAS/SEC14 domain-containing protein [Roseicyclus sp.]